MQHVKKNEKDLVNFDLSTRNSQNFHFNCVKYTFDIKNTEELSLMTLNSDSKFEEKLTCGLVNDMRNLANVYQSTRKSQNWTLVGFFYPK